MSLRRSILCYFLCGATVARMRCRVYDVLDEHSESALRAGASFVVLSTGFSRNEWCALRGSYVPN